MSWLTSEELADKVGVTPTTIRRWAHDDRIPGAVRSRRGRGEYKEYSFPAAAVDFLKREGPLEDPRKEEKRQRKKQKEKDASDSSSSTEGGA